MRGLDAIEQEVLRAAMDPIVRDITNFPKYHLDAVERMVQRGCLARIPIVEDGRHGHETQITALGRIAYRVGRTP